MSPDAELMGIFHCEIHLQTQVRTVEVSRCWSHLALAEQVLLPEGEEDDVPEVSRVFDADLVRSILQHSARLVNDPVGAEERQHQAARRLHHVDVHIHRHAAVQVTGETHGKELGHFLFDPEVSMPVATLIPHQHQRHHLA